MRHYLINGYLEFTGKPFRCILGGRAILEDHEVMDHATLRKVEALLLAEQLELRKAGKGVAAWAEPCGFKVTGFQPYEVENPVPAALSAEQVASLARAAEHDTLLGQLKELRAVLRKLGWEVKNGVVQSVIRLLSNQVALNEAVQLNECSVIMPPVDSPIMIEIAPGVLLKASRPAHAEARGDQLVFNLETHGQFVGRPRWTHP